MPKKYLIISPHPDDEIIGCFSIIKKNRGYVDVFFPITPIPSRLNESLSASYELGYNIIDSNNINFKTYDEILVPSKYDYHPEHILVHNKYKDIATLYYSVEKNVYTLDILDEKDIRIKKQILEKHFKSQDIWRKNDKYLLFESIVKSEKKSYIFVNTNFEGFHKYDNAPKQVSFLRNLHRHIFYVNVKIEVFHNNREIEFFLFKEFINTILNKLNKSDVGSCENIANILVDKISSTFPNRKIYVTISEDNENGVIVEN